MEEQDVIDQSFGGVNELSMSPPTLFDVIGEPQSIPCAVEMIPTPTPQMNSTKWKDLIIGEGQIFPNATTLRKTLYKYSLCQKFSYVFIKNNQQKIIVKCKVDGCPWYMGAYSMGAHQDTEFLTIRTYKSEHIHHAQDNLIVPHSGRSNLAASIVIDDLRCNVDKSPNEIRKDLYKEYGVQLNYTQAYRVRKRALMELHGRVEDSYKVIPWMCERLMETDPDTVARWEGSDSNRFERLFIAYGCSIKGFVEGCRPIIYIDGCHLSGPYKGTLLSACAFDADNELFPLAYDQSNAIIGAVKTVFDGDRHAFCYRHVKENYSAQYVKINRGVRRTSENNKENALNLLDGIAYARHDNEFNVAMGNLRLFCPQLAQWVESHGDVDRWAQSKFPFKRWDNITNNLAESFNAWMLKERKHTLPVLIQEHQEKLAKKMVASKMGMKSWKNGVGPNIESKLSEQIARGACMEATYYGDDHISVQTIREGRIIYVAVDLISHRCTCLAWQMSGIPCPHACAAIKLVHRSVYDYVDDCYKLSTQEKIYANSMRPIATHDCPQPDAPIVSHMLTQTFLHPLITKRPPGRPRINRIESQFQNKRVYHCGRCKEPGHTAKTCKNPNPS
ncbi:uncharacterized protein LOC114760781 [Neltuma alba]|uniref:uncharacterized protein LOC114760781 n=1 Tax=Neltuma alba TaxID=207710 RepID=UPI0010A44FE4|nr:uncharacterized protein LOC114760781 [Prosopis alba]